MKTHPILFSTPMVQDILEGRKTMTRRIIKSPTGSFGIGMAKYEPNTNFHYHNREVIALDENDRSVKNILCPYGKPGDILWVRESYLWVMRDHAHDLLEGNQDGVQWVYKASINSDWIEYAKEKYGYKWRPSIHMPKAAARIFLKITDIKVERLQDITREECKKEGVLLGIDNGKFAGWHDIFRDLWENINGPDSWQSNPWIWVIAFERCEKPENFLTS